jgi:predicted dehydrogenase
MKHILHFSRRQFLKTSLAGAAGVSMMPTIIPSSVLGADAPSNQIQIGQIGCGRIANEMDMPGILKHDIARVVAVCDLDSKRLGLAKARVEKHYAGKTGSPTALVVKGFGDYRELLKDGQIDAVAISTPDHWHSEPVIAAALAGKDVYVQKPLSMTLVEGREVSDTVTAKKRAFQIGSQQRSDSPWPQFRRACELVRNGRIGKVHTVKVGLPTDPSGGSTKEEPVPANLNYAMWLGWTPEAPYCEDRVHPQDSLTARPGWLRIDSYCLGMITGWGSHHMDIAHWGMDTELTGPIEADGHAEFPKSGLWNVHGPYHIEMKYANGATVIIDNKFENGVRFEGSEGWIFVSRGSAKATASDPATGNSKAFAASSPTIMKSVIGPNETHLYTNLAGEHDDFLKCVKSRKDPYFPVDIGHRVSTVCHLANISIRLGRKLKWDPKAERFEHDAEANKMLSRPMRRPWSLSAAS